MLQELYGDEEFGDKIYAVKEFRFVPLVKGRVHLVALVDVTGRAFFNSIKAIYCQNRTCEVVSTHSFGDVDLRSQLIDTDHDGLSELVARDQVNVDWFPIFTYRRAKLRGEEFVDVSAESKEAWEKYVEPLIKADFDYQDIKLRELQQSRTVAKPADEVNRKRSEKAVQEFAALIDCARVIARADAARRVYGRPEAGVEDAAQWLQSPYQEIRELGLQTLVTIDSGLAAEVLTGVDMSAYPEWIVSSAQKMIKKRRPR
ncbi:MAG: hypothetical protein FJW30_24395 [Acidobacteria bacterium]|nr:hypothetical protein [Acidobacteriota bacterium]